MNFMIIKFKYRENQGRARVRTCEACFYNLHGAPSRPISRTGERVPQTLNPKVSNLPYPLNALAR